MLTEEQHATVDRTSSESGINKRQEHVDFVWTLCWPLYCLVAAACMLASLEQLGINEQEIVDLSRSNTLGPSKQTWRVIGLTQRVNNDMGTQRPNNYMGETSEPDSHHTATRHWTVTKQASKRAAATMQSPDAHSGQHNVQTSNVSIFV